VLREIREFGSLLIVHAEDSDAIDRAPTAHGELYRDYLASRPRGAENVAIAQVIEAARWTRARVHILHLSSSDCPADDSHRARDGVRITVETCPHYLLFTAEEVPDGQTQFKCCPPIREADNRELLWHGLRTGDVGLHRLRPFAVHAELKALRARRLRGCLGRDSLAAGRPAGGVDQARRRGFTLCDVVRWMPSVRRRSPACTARATSPWATTRTSAFFALDDAFLVDPARLHHRHPVTPTRGARWPAWCAVPGCTASGSATRTTRAGGCFAEVRHELVDRRRDTHTNAPKRCGMTESHDFVTLPTWRPDRWAAVCPTPTTSCSPSGRT